MRFNTRSSIKKNKFKFYGAFFLLALIMNFWIISDHKDYDNSFEKSQSNDDSNLENLLIKAEHHVRFSTDSAELFAAKLFELASRQGRDRYIVRALITLGNIKKLKGNQLLAQQFYRKAAELAKQKKMVAYECEAILNIGEVIYKRGEYDLSMVEFLKADSLAVKNKLEAWESCALYYLGKYNQTKGNFEKAKFYYQRSLTIARKNKDEKQLALLLPSLGKYFISEGKLNLALRSYQEAFNISMSLNDPFLSADICNHLGGLYLELKEFEKAMDYQRRALQYRLDMNYPGELAKSYNNIGKIHLCLKQLDSAEIYFSKSLKLCQKTDYKKGLVKALTNLGEVNRIRGRMIKSSGYLFEAFEIAMSIGYDNGIAEASLDLGELFSARKHLDSAIVYYNIALDKYGKTNYNEDLLRTYKGLYTSYLAKSDYKTALGYHESILETEKKLLDVENKRQLAIVNISFDTERKEQDYKVLLKDHELQASLIKSKNTFIWLIVAVLGFTILLCLYVYNRFYIKKKANKKLEDLNLTITDQNIQLKNLNKDIESVSKEKDKLFAIISHELRNPLYWLQNLAEVLSRKHNTMPADKISKTLISMDESAKNVYHLMDNLLHWSRSKLNRVHPKKLRHNLFKLITDVTRMYETFLQQKEISLSVDISKDIYIRVDADLFACVLRNLVSNAIKYTPNGGIINLEHEQHKDFVTVIISDSGKGMAVSDLKTIFKDDNSGISMPGLMQEKGSGLGLKLCKDFVEMNDGRIWVESTEGRGTKFFFTVPHSRHVIKTTTNEELAEHDV
jgi:signal transduction histidine kinase/Tfp pilus assembly protein PilF